MRHQTMDRLNFRANWAWMILLEGLLLFFLLFEMIYRFLSFRSFWYICSLDRLRYRLWFLLSRGLIFRGILILLRNCGWLYLLVNLRNILKQFSCYVFCTGLKIFDYFLYLLLWLICCLLYFQRYLDIHNFILLMSIIAYILSLF